MSKPSGPSEPSSYACNFLAMLGWCLEGPCFLIEHVPHQKDCIRKII